MSRRPDSRSRREQASGSSQSSEDALDRALSLAFQSDELFSSAYTEALSDRICAAVRRESKLVSAPESRPGPRFADAGHEAHELQDLRPSARRAQLPATQRPNIRSPWAILGPFAAAALLLIGLGLSWRDEQILQDPPLPTLARAKNSGLLLRRAGQWQRLAEGQGILAEDDQAVVQNLSREPAQLVLDNGTTITLRSDTTAALRQYTDPDQDSQLASQQVPHQVFELDLRSGVGGEVLCKVTPGHGRFIVRTPDLTVTVLGTEFLVRSVGGRSRVVVLSGKVRCDDVEGSQLALLTRAQELELQGHELERQIPQIRQGVDLTKHTAWLRSSAPAPSEASASNASPSNDPSERPAEPAPKPSEGDANLDNPFQPPRRPLIQKPDSKH